MRYDKGLQEWIQCRSTNPRFYNLLKLCIPPSGFTYPRWLLLISFRVLTPARPIVNLSSFSSTSSTSSTPSWPPYAKPQRTGLPMKHKSAPIARALNTSVPRVTPLSNRIGIFEWAGRSTLTISCRASSDDGHVSSWRPPWLDTQTASTLFSTATFASSSVRMPYECQKVCLL